MDLRDIFNAIDSAESKHQIEGKIRNLENSNYDLQNKCGSCEHWMKSTCGREKHHKVSCGENICNNFSIDSFYLGMISKNKAELQELNNQLQNKMI